MATKTKTSILFSVGRDGEIVHKQEIESFETKLKGAFLKLDDTDFNELVSNAFRDQETEGHPIVIYIRKGKPTDESIID